jgi:general secretion pathway protein D
MTAIRKPLYLLAATCLALSSITSLTPAFAQQDPAAPNEQEYAKDSNTEINVKNADIAAIIRIFSRKTKRNYILDEKVRGKVSIYLPGKVSADESLRILDSVLALKGFAAVPIGENLWKIVPAKEARQSTIPTQTDGRVDHPSSSVVTRLVALKYVNAQDVQQIVSQLISGDGLVNAYTGTNSLILIDGEDNIQRLLKIIDELDVPFSNREMTIIPVAHADVEDIAQKLNDILGDGSSKKDGGAQAGDVRASMTDPNVAAQAQASGSGLSRASGGKTIAARGITPKIIPDQRTNSIIVVADDETTARVRALIAQLDSKVDRSGNKFYVYRCQHANAEELAQVLAGLVGGGSSSGIGGSSRSGGLGGSGSSGSGLGGMSQSGGFGSNQDSFGNSSSSRSGSGMFSRAGSGQRSGSSNKLSPTSTQLGDNISITADPATNSLIIAASKPDYEKIRSLLAQIDIKRRQALVEATLLEVSIDNTIRTSTSFLTSTGGDDGGVLAKSEFSSDHGLAQLLSAPDKLQGLTLAAASAGSLTLPGGLKIPTQTVLVSAAQQNNNINVLSSPTILATDNEEAQIIVGNTVPFIASTGTNATNLNNTFNQIDRQDVGITLRITPQISSRDYVTLKVYTEVSNLVLSTINSQYGPTTQKRQSETTIIAKDGQMIVTGGLIADDLSETDEGIPYLKDIPVLGHAFKANSTARAQKNLLIFLTPRIIKDQFDARDSTIESRDKLKDVIAHYNVNPKRSATLDSDRIDRVAESNPYEGPKPGTILPPAKKPKVNPAPLSDDKNDAVILDGSSDGVLDLDAGTSAPAAAAAPAKKAAPDEEAILDLDEAPAQPEPKASLHLSSAKQATSLSQGAFVVLENANKGRIPSGLPFAGAAPGSSVGIIIPSDSSATARSFFAAGRTYLYSNGSRKLEFRVRRVFPSPSDAESMYPEVSGTWRTLSNTEVSALGKGPWLSKASK